MQSEHHGHGLTDNLVVQIGAAIVLIGAVIALAWFMVF
jgi:hypothetical protein